MKIGDLISVLDDTTTGKIISLTAGSALIRDEFGFTQEVQLSKIISREETFYQEIPVELKQDDFKIKSKKNVSQIRNLDLHFEKLVKNHLKFSAWERLEIQKETLKNELDYCKKNNIKKLNIIHGIGSGVLQQMVYDVLRSSTNILFEENDFFKDSSGNIVVAIM